jgi:hypothetical protein
MSTSDIYLAVFLGNQRSPRWQAWAALANDERHVQEQAGLAAWKAWVAEHEDAIVNHGGPLGKTKRIAVDGIVDVSNDLNVFMVVRAASHDAAARMFEGHPHFTIFPGDAVEVMPLLPVPEA